MDWESQEQASLRMSKPENASTVVTADPGEKYKNWILEHLEWLQDYTSNETMVLVKMISKGLLMPNEREAIMAKTTTSEKWQEVYFKIQRLGLEKIDVVIDILQNTTNDHVANKFMEFKGSLEKDETSIR